MTDIKPFADTKNWSRKLPLAKTAVKAVMRVCTIANAHFQESEILECKMQTLLSNCIPLFYTDVDKMQTAFNWNFWKILRNVVCSIIWIKEMKQKKNNKSFVRSSSDRVSFVIRNVFVALNAWLQIARTNYGISSAANKRGTEDGDGESGDGDILNPSKSLTQMLKIEQFTRQRHKSSGKFTECGNFSLTKIYIFLSFSLSNASTALLWKCWKRKIEKLFKKQHSDNLPPLIMKVAKVLLEKVVRFWPKPLSHSMRMVEVQEKEKTQRTDAQKRPIENWKTAKLHFWEEKIEQKC